MAPPPPCGFPWGLWLALALLSSAFQPAENESQDPSESAYFLPEFALSPQGSFQEDTTGERLLTYRHDDQASRTTRSDEDREVGWDAWGTWSDCSRSCGGGASYSLRRCLSGSCEGRNIRYRTCSNMECPADTGDFRAQQCSAHNDVKYQGQLYEWMPASHEPAAPCALRCQARGHGPVVELAPKVLDGTRCRAGSPDMCINGVCEEVGCDRQLGSNAKEDNCGVCGGDSSTCRLVRGQTLPAVSMEEPMKTAVEIPLGSRDVRLMAKGPDLLVMETHSLHGLREDLVLGSSGSYVIQNSTLEVQKAGDRLTLRAPGPLAADFSIKLRYSAPRNTLVQFSFYQPIRYQWRETDFFPCTVTCGGGYQLNSAECTDTRLKRAVPDHHCHLYPENRKPKPKLRECGSEPCLESDGYKEVMPYDQFQPLPRWEQNPWTSCSASCKGGMQSRSVACVEEDVHGQVSQVEEWKCMHSPRPAMQQDCNTFDCPHWTAMEWSQCTVTCGRGLRYRVVLCLDHRGRHAGGCHAGRKPHVKEDCLVPVACYRPREKLPVEAKSPWQKQAQELEMSRAGAEEPTFITGPWLPCSAPCGPGRQSRWVKCRVLLSFTQAEVDLPDRECEEERPSSERPCNLGSCDGTPLLQQGEPLYSWEHVGFTACSSSCAAGIQQTVLNCLRSGSQEVVEETLCRNSSRPPTATRVCNPHPCPPRWVLGPWTLCTASCGVGIQTRSVHCSQLHSVDPEDAVTLSDDQCEDFKPSVLRACNQVDCPPSWQAEEWQQCSHTCGGGTQSRKVHCKQQLSTGAFHRLPDASCPKARPASHKPCARTPCPPQMAGGDWSKCSVSCGTGVQQREPVCRRLMATGQQVTLGREACGGLAAPPLIRACRMNPCSKPVKEASPRQPRILGVHRIYIQTRQEKRVQLTVGGRAYLLPKTSVVIRCPVRKFQKLHITWEKDGKGLLSSRRLGITKSGSLKIHGLEARDAGVYRCVAGPASESFVLKLTGSYRLAEPSMGRDAEAKHGGPLTKLDLGSETSQNGSRGNELYTMDSPVEDEAFMQALRGYLTSSDWPRNEHLEVLQGGHSLEPRQFAELLRNISLAGERSVATPLSEHLATSGVWTSPSRKAIDRTFKLSETANGKAAGQVPRQWKKPIIIQLDARPLMDFEEDIRMNAGQNAILTNATRSVTLLCTAQGSPEPSVSWTIDGQPLRQTERVSLDGTGVLHISNPSVDDQGVYQCTATNELGSDTQSSQLFMAEPPIIAASKSDVSDAQSSVLQVVVGGRVAVDPKANISLLCPVSGMPRPNITWSKAEGSMTPNAVPLPDGSLLLREVSPDEFGTYSCTASNHLGVAVASSHVSTIGPATRGRHLQQIASHRRVLMASHAGTRIAVRRGDVLRIGCPIPSSLTQPISWYFQNRSLQASRSLRYRTLAEGRVLEVDTLSGRFQGSYVCQTASRSSSALAQVHVSEEVFRWQPGVWTACSASCGHRGLRSRRQHCTDSGGQEVPVALCQHVPQPASPTQPCGVQDCPPSWESAVWSECSTSCGRGHRWRQVTCQQKLAGGAVRRRPESACGRGTRPTGREDCHLLPCVAWQFSPWPPCSGLCIGPGLALQSRPVICKHSNGSALPSSHCDPRTRPSSERNCSWEVCATWWKVGPWQPCSAACGSGFRSRRVECVHQGTGRTVAEQHCAWRRRPVPWQHCRASPCDGTCRDSTHYCSAVKRLHLCPLSLYRQRCCQTCAEEVVRSL
ncbi:ADAMTS-like protein 3 isoform X1 [Brienomyrus brachyistius]|uniref:ADAMTS-like protein 3 isoform X1 n=2 Tax=Brienomyrus brachyistius TaxID=42636 RepID=UPI0020B1ABED|nr:ADAMTS-like protein 3 isoform X1 [Brienomyrus brachyistius]